jgi:hypothetical protein
MVNSSNATTAGDDCLEPCMDNTAPNFETKLECASGQSYSQADVTSCYCQQKIAQYVSEYGSVKGAYFAITELDGICAEMTG